MKAKEKTQKDISSPIEINFRDELAKSLKRRRRSKRWLFISLLSLSSFVVISYVGMTVGEFLSNATSINLSKSNSDIEVSSLGFRVSKEISLTDQNKYGLFADVNNDEDNLIYWARANINPTLTRFIMDHEGYASSNTLYPVTTGTYQKGQPVDLFVQPNPFNAYPIVNPKIAANKKDYLFLDLLVKIGFENPANPSSLKDYRLHIDRTIDFFGNDNIARSLRFGFESNYNDILMSDIISPGRNEAGETLVGGRLDLDQDGFYDYTIDKVKLQETDLEAYKYEIAYGDFEYLNKDDSWAEVNPADVVNPNPKSFFMANSKENIKPLVNYRPAVAQYNRFSAYYDNLDDSDPIAFTDESGIAEVKVKIWLEGWDRYTTNSLIGHTFGAQLRFAIANP